MRLGRHFFFLLKAYSQWSRRDASVCAWVTLSHSHTAKAGMTFKYLKIPYMQKDHMLSDMEPWRCVKYAKNTIWPLSHLRGFTKTPTIFKVKLPNTCIIRPRLFPPALQYVGIGACTVRGVQR